MEKLENYGFVYNLKKGASDRAILLLHGWGADEDDLIPIGENLDPEATLISPRGKVVQEGMKRFFERSADMTPNLQDLELRTNELKEFVQQVCKKNNIIPDNLTGLGFSNGAATLLTLVDRHSNILKNVVLLRPVYPAELITSQHKENLSSLNIFISSGTDDHFISLEQSTKLHNIVKAYNPNTTTYIHNGGHQLGPDDLEEVRKFYGKVR